MASMRRVNVGIVGCGRIANLRHLPALRRLDDVDVVAVADVDPGRLEATADRFGVARRHTDHHSLVSDPAVELVAVCVPVIAHADVAVAALEAGKHVFLEKPVALSVDDGDRIRAAAAGAAGKVVVGFNLRWHRLVAQARDLVRAGVIGNVEGVTTRMTSPFTYREVAHPWRRDRSRGGGVLYEMAPHHFDLWRLFTRSEVTELHAFSRSTDWHDESALVGGRTERGAFVGSFFSQRAPEANEVEVSGDEGRLRFSLYRFDSLEVTPRTTPIGEVRHRLRRMAAQIRAVPAGVIVARRGGDFVDSYRRAWEHVAAVARDDVEVECTLEDGLRVLEIMLAAGEAAASGEVVPVRTATARAVA